MRKTLSVVLGTYNRLPFLKLTLASIREELSRCSCTSEIIIVDGGSTDGTLKWLLQQKDVIIIVQHNRSEWRGKPVERRSWGYFMNLGFKCAQGKYVCMLSDDCLIVPGAIVNGYKRFEEELNKGIKVGAIAFYWRNWPEQKKYWVGLTLGNKMFVNHGMYLRQALEEVNFIDEDAFFFYHADGDLCLKMWQKGYFCVDSPDSFIEHYSHANNNARQSNLMQERSDLASLLKRWEGVWYDSIDKLGGGWIEKEFMDNSQVADNFTDIGRAKKHIVSMRDKIKKWM